MHRPCEPVKNLVFICSLSICSPPLRRGLCCTDEAGKQCDVLGKQLLFQWRFAKRGSCCLWFLIIHHEINTHLYFSATRPKRNTTRLHWQGEILESMIQCSFMALLYIFQLMYPCAAVVNRAALHWTQRAPGTCCSVCAFAIGTRTHSDRHLPFCYNPFYTSSPDDKSYFPYRHSQKELGEKQLIMCRWVEYLSPSYCFPSRMYCIQITEWFNE